MNPILSSEFGEELRAMKYLGSRWICVNFWPGFYRAWNQGPVKYRVRLRDR